MGEHHDTEYWEDQWNLAHDEDYYDIEDTYPIDIDEDVYEDIWMFPRLYVIRADMRRPWWRIRHFVLYRISKKYRDDIDAIPF